MERSRVLIGLRKTWGRLFDVLIVERLTGEIGRRKVTDSPFQEILETQSSALNVMLCK